MLRFIIVLLLFAGCQHRPLASQLAEAGDCEAAFNEIPWETAQIKFTESSKQVAGTAASYTAAGVGYLTDAFVFAGEGAYKSIIYCPYATVALAAAVAMGSGTPHFVFCGKNKVKVEGSRIGQKIYYRTTHFRKADFDKISEMNRNGANCYATKGGNENKRVAAEKLQPIATDDTFLKNLSADERDKLKADYKLYSE